MYKSGVKFGFKKYQFYQNVVNHFPTRIYSLVELQIIFFIVYGRR